MKDLLFYDGSCPLCAGEIRLLSRLKGKRLELIDIHSEKSEGLTDSKNASELLAVLHLKTASGDWQLGLDATVSAWRHTSFGWLLMPLRWPLIRGFADWAYYRWADKRACRLGLRGKAK